MSAEQARLSLGAVINMIRTAIKCVEHGQYEAAHAFHDRARLELERADAALPVEDCRTKRIQQLSNKAGAHA